LSYPLARRGRTGFAPLHASYIQPNRLEVPAPDRPTTIWAAFGAPKDAFYIGQPEPSLLPVFGKLGVKPPVVIAAAPITSKVMHKMANRIREILSLHGGGLALKLSVLVWTILVLAAVFFISQA
jgi:hypothetical protein